MTVTVLSARRESHNVFNLLRVFALTSISFVQRALSISALYQLFRARKTGGEGNVRRISKVGSARWPNLEDSCFGANWDARTDRRDSQHLTGRMAVDIVLVLAAVPRSCGIG